MAQDSNGRLYVANNEGLLVFNGTNWQLFPLPNKTILRSIAFGADGRLYAGAQDELGYFAPDQAGRLQFNSIKNLLPATERTFADVWNIEVIGNDVFYRANEKIIKLSGNEVSVYHPTSAWLSMNKYNGRLLAQDEQKGLLVYQNGSWNVLIEKTGLPRDFIITDMISFRGDTSLLSTTKLGLFLLARDTLLRFELKNSDEPKYCTSLSAVGQNNFLVGSYANGIYRINLQGDVIEKIDSKNGLLNNTVRSIYTDQGGNVWMGLDNGICFMPDNSAIKHINPPAFNNGGGYGVTVLNNRIYFALSTGLQWLPVSPASDLGTITAEPKTILNGQTWDLSVISNQLLAGRDDGFWKVNNAQADCISTTSGYWIYKPVTYASNTLIAAGNYRGINLFEQQNGNYTYKGGIPEFSESSRYIETDANSIWVSHPYRGVFSIHLPDYKVTKYTRLNGLPDDLDNHVFKIKGKIVFATPRGIYEYEKENDKIVPSAQYNALFGQLPLRYLREDENGNIWFVQDKMVGIADFSGVQPVIHYIPELKNRLLSGFENIYPFDKQNVFIGSETGFYLINYDKYQKNIRPFKAYLTRVQIISLADSVLYGGYGLWKDKNIQRSALPYEWNSLHFSYAISTYSQQQSTEYSYYLQGFDKNWSNWSIPHEKDYTNLPEGNYTFRVKARISPTHESEECTYVFTIDPPWYRTWWAFLLYLIFFVAVLYFLYKYQAEKNKRKQEIRRLADQKEFEEMQRRVADQHQLELEKSGKEVMRLRNENLESEIELKNAELANTAMNLVQKKEFLLKIADTLNKLNKSGTENIEAGELKKILRSLGSEEKLDEEWKQFSIHFNNVHSNFLITLKKKYAYLNAHELKLCAYLRMNLSSKEIARLMSISVRGVEISRYRLRKKLQLQPKEDLFQFLLTIESTDS